MRGRLALVAAAVTTMVVIAFVVPLALLVRGQVESRALADAERTAQSVAAAVAVAGSFDELTPRVVTAVLDATDPGRDVTVYVGDDLIGTPADRSPAVEAGMGGRALTAETDGGAEVVVPVLGLSERVVVRAFVSDAERTEGVVVAWALLAALGLGLVLVSIVVADRLARAVVDPVTRLAEAAGRLGEGDTTTRVDPAGPPEVADLGRSFNDLARQLDDLLVAERESVADLSHRLRTPLAALRLQAETMTDEGEKASLLKDVDRLQKAIDRLIADARRPESPVRAADLVEVAAERLAFWRVLADEQDRQVNAVFEDGPITVAVGGEDLAAVVDALLENVFAHTPPGTAFSLAVESNGLTGSLIIEDDGPGLGDAEVRRGASRGGSTGLGLDIVRRAAERSGGSLSVENRSGGGARVEAAFGVQ